MTSRKLIVVFFVISIIVCPKVIAVNINNEIKITHFKAHNDFTESEVFKAKERIIFYVIWNIPEGVRLNGEAALSFEGESNEGEKWIIEDKKYLRPDIISDYWGWDCYQKIPKEAKPGSIATATVELKIDENETVKKVLTIKINER